MCLIFASLSLPRCLTQDDTRRIETVEAATRTVTETGTETETETETGGEGNDTEGRPHTPPAATETGTEGDEEDTARKGAMHAQGGLFAHIEIIYLFFNVLKMGLNIPTFLFPLVVAMTIAPRSTGRLTEGTWRDTDGWIRAETETETGSRTAPPRVTIHGTSPRTCTTIAAAERGSESETSRTDGKAAGVSTNEGGVEPGPIAHHPR